MILNPIDIIHQQLAVVQSFDINDYLTDKNQLDTHRFIRLPAGIVRRFITNTEQFLTGIVFFNGQAIHYHDGQWIATISLYLIQSESGYIKIGISKRVERRLRDLQISSPEKLTLLFYQPLQKAELIEKKLHQRFSDKRLRGEWFDLTPDDIQWVMTKYA